MKLAHPLRHSGLIAAFVLAFFGAALTGCSERERAPTLNYTLLDGSQHSTAALKGRVVLINFWATTCTTCIKEIPHLVEAYQRLHAQGLDVLSVAMSHDKLDYVTEFARARQLPYPVTFDRSGELAQGFGKVQITPTTFVLNKKGDIIKRFVGEPDYAQLDTLLKELLAEAV